MIVFTGQVDADICGDGNGLEINCVLSATKLSMNNS